jgi:hypothetical protein
VSGKIRKRSKSLNVFKKSDLAGCDFHLTDGSIHDFFRRDLLVANNFFKLLRNLKCLQTRSKTKNAVPTKAKVFQVFVSYGIA